MARPRRDSRVELEQAGDAAWHRLVMATYVLERLEHEEQRLSACRTCMNTCIYAHVNQACVCTVARLHTGTQTD